jgi:hypothetical protein
MVQKAREEIGKIREELGEIPIEATELIIFLNSKNKWELEAMDIEDMKETILEVKKVLTKKGLMLHLEEKAKVMDIGVHIFFSKIEVIHKKGLPRLQLEDKCSGKGWILTPFLSYSPHLISIDPTILLPFLVKKTS